MNITANRFVTLVLAGTLFGCCQNSSPRTSVEKMAGQSSINLSQKLPAHQIFTINPSYFGNVIDNPYFPRVPGSRYVYEGQTTNGPERVELQVLHTTKEILGVKTTIVRDTVFLNNQIIEDTYDWFAQDIEGNVWYFGENVSDYKNGVLVSKAGSWQAGVDGAQPGIVMFAQPAEHLGKSYFLEYYKGEAEDAATLISVSEDVIVPYGSFEDVVQTYDYTPLAPDAREHKFFAKGVGEIKSINIVTGDEVVLVEFFTPK